tara:strand:- start:3990 stop:6305 length:2316 start_codon:yes stop_codon:yes gene_type:complete
LGKSSKVWTYLDEAGEALFHVARFELKQGDKEYRPLTLWDEDGHIRWRWKAAPVPRPLYGLEKLAGAPSAPVLLVEGEKAADAAIALFPDAVAVTWCGGSNAVSKADWSALSGRTIAIIPDADEAGSKAAKAAKSALRKVRARASIVELPHDLPKGWDVADAFPNGFTLEKLENLITQSLTHADAKADDCATAPAASDDGAVWPFGFRMDTDGLWHDDGQKKPLRISDPFTLVGLGRDPAGGDWGLLIGFRDPDGRQKEEFIPKNKLAGQGAEIRGHLAAAGLWIATGQGAANRFVEALNSLRSKNRVLMVSATGWTSGDRFVLPHCIIGGDPSEPARFSGDARGVHYGQRGSLDAWKQDVAAPLADHALGVFALCVGFAGPLLGLMEGDGGGFHLRGSSSSGKTTLARIAGSVWGGGGPLGFGVSWRATSNALEGVAVAHSQTLLVLDELALVSADEAGPAAYQLASGSAKNRARADGGLRDQASWRVMILSTGEIGLADHVRSGKRGDRAMAGQEIRLLDLEADGGAGQGVWSRMNSDLGPAEFSDRLRSAIDANYGLASIAFLEDIAADRKAAKAEAEKLVTEFEAMARVSGDTGQVNRALRRFSLVAAAGEIAIRAGILPWPEGVATQSVLKVFEGWAAGFGRSQLREDRSAIMAVRDALETHQTKFGAVREEEEYAETDRAGEARAMDSWGYRWTAPTGERLFLFNNSAWNNEVLQNHDPRRAARALRDAGLLHCDGEDRLKKKVRVRGRHQNFYAVSEHVLEWDG